MKKLLLFALIAALVFPFVGCSDDDDDDPPPDPPFGPSLIAVGDDGNMLTSGDCVGWSLTDLTGQGSITTLDMVEVIKIPNTNIFITYGWDSSATVDSEIWYSTDGGSNWLEATINELTDVRASTYFIITDMHFMNSLEGIAVGTDGLILATYDAGVTWDELNTWSDTGLTTNPGDVELDIYNIAGTSGNPVQGTVVSQDQGGTPAVIVTGTVTCWDDNTNEFVVTGVAGGTFNGTDTLTWGTDGTADMYTPVEDDVWRYDFNTLNCVFGVETVGTGTDTTLTIWAANGSGAQYEGVWKLVSNAALPGAAARTWTWTTPSETIQEGTVVGDFSYDTTYRFFFFDDMTGVAARQTNGILYTEDGGATWTYGSNTDISGFNEYWSEFWYIDNGATGWLYSLENDGYLARVGIDYSATATPPYQFNTTTADWEVLTDSGTNNGAQSDDHTGVVLWSNKVYAICESGSGYWTWGSTIGSVLFDDDVYTDPWDTYLGENTLLGDSPIDDQYIEVGTTSYYLNHWCQR